MSSSDALNPRLYAVLRERFGDVHVSNPGEQVRLTDAVADTPVMRRKGLRITADMVEGGERYGVNCPFCGDRYGRLSISYAWGTQVDYNGLSVSFPQSLAICFNENCLSNPDHWQELKRLLGGAANGEQLLVLPAPPVRQVSKVDALPEGLLVNDARLPEYVRDYLVGERRFDLDELARDYQVQVSVIPFYDNPVLVFPVRQQNQLAFWQARCIGKCQEKFADGKEKPKYYTAKGTKKSWTLYNLDQAQSETRVVLVEGVFDAMRVGPAGVAMFGSKPSLAQERMLYALWQRGELVWLPDQDDPKAWDVAAGFIEAWNARRLFAGGARAVKLPAGKDPADCTREELWKLIDRR